MPILSKGYTFAPDEQVTSTKLSTLVDNAAFVSGAVDGQTMDLSSGKLIVRNLGITPTKLSAGAPVWDDSYNLTVSGNTTLNGTLTTGGTISTSGSLAVNGTATIAGVTTLNGTSAVNANMTVNAQIVRSGTESNRTVELVTGSSPGAANAISFGWDSANNDLLVTIDNSQFKVTLTAV